MSVTRRNLGLEGLTLSNEQKVKYIYLILLGIITLMIHVRLYEYAADDAYIHFRVARNFLETGTPYYNPGEAIKVSTSSAWTIFLTVILLILRSIGSQNQLLIVVSIINSLFTFFGMVIYTKIIRGLAKNTINPLLEALFQIAYIAILSIASIELMETSSALFAAGIGLYLLQSSKRTGFILLALAAYLRIELVTLLALGLGISLLRNNIRFVDAVLYSSLGLAIFIAFDLYFFQTLLPHSIKAKSIIYVISRQDTFEAVVLSLFPTGVVIKQQADIYNINLIICFSLFLSMIYESPHAFRNNRGQYLILFFSWSLLTSILYTLGHAFVFEWYVPLYAIPLLISTILLTRSSNSLRRLIAIITLLVMAFGNIYILKQTLHASCCSLGYFQAFEIGSRVKMYKHIASIINTEYPDETLLSSEIGGLGYGFKGKIIDAAGLATPEALKYHPLNVPNERASGRIGAIPPRFVEATLPGVIVSYDVFAASLINSAVAHQYNILLIPAYLPEDQVLTEKKTIFGSEYIRVYIRKDLPVSRKLLELSER